MRITQANILYLLCFFLFCTPQQGSTLEKKAFDIEGTWVLYAGGCVAPEVLHFCRDGSGTAYDLVDDCDEVWLNGDPLSLDMVENPNNFIWRIVGQEDDVCESAPKMLLIEYQNNNKTMIYELDY